VGFPGYDANHSILFLYRETDKLVSRKEWDALDLPLDTRLVNGIIHVKVAYNDDAHMVTVYRFTNSGYLDSREFGEYERAKGTALVPSEAKVKKAKSIKK
jgi:predicted transcriptional regulator